jgi:hypothetical protein
MGIRGLIAAYVGSAFKYVFQNKMRKSFKEIRLEGAFGDGRTDYNPKLADLGWVIIVVIVVLICILETVFR